MYWELWEAGAGKEEEGETEELEVDRKSLPARAKPHDQARPRSTGSRNVVEAHGQGNFGPGGTTGSHCRYKTGHI